MDHLHGADRLKLGAAVAKRYRNATFSLLFRCAHAMHAMFSNEGGFR